MEQIFNTFSGSGKNNIDVFMNLLKKVGMMTGQNEGDIRELFNDVADALNINFGEFQQVINKLAGFLQREPQAVTDELTQAMQQEAAQGFADTAGQAAAGVENAANQANQAASSAAGAVEGAAKNLAGAAKKLF